MLSRPEPINAGKKAFAPGIIETGISFSMQCLTIIAPGSEIPGYPASLVIAIDFPCFNKSINLVELSCSLCSW